MVNHFIFFRAEVNSGSIETKSTLAAEKVP